MKLSREGAELGLPHYFLDLSLLTHTPLHLLHLIPGSQVPKVLGPAVGSGHRGRGQCFCPGGRSHQRGWEGRSLPFDQ